MNRYVADGIINDLKAGKSVTITAPSMRRARFCFMEISARLEHDPQVKKILRGNGAEKVVFTNGATLQFLSANKDNLDNHETDVLVVEGSEVMDAQVTQKTFDYHYRTRSEVVRA